MGQHGDEGGLVRVERRAGKERGELAPSASWFLFLSRHLGI